MHRVRRHTSIVIMAAQEVCRAFRKTGRCRYEDACKFEHSEGEPIPQPPPGVCFEFRDGECTRGNSCRFMHGDADTRFEAGADGILQRAPQDRACSDCGESFNKASGSFSLNQWAKPEDQRRCRQCVDDNAATNAAQSDDGEKKKKKRRPRKTAEALVCWNCGDEGHASRECEQPKDESNSFSECFNCREIGHISSQCVMPCRKCGGDDHASHNCEER